MRSFLQIVFGDELFGQRSARPFRQHRDLRLQVISGLKVRLLLVLLVDAFVVGADAGDLFAFSKQLRAGKSGENGDARLLNFFSQPLYKAVDGDHVVAVVLQRRRRDGQAVLAFFGEEVNVFVRDLGVEGRFVAPAGKQFVHGAGIKQRAGERVLAQLTRLLQHVNIFLAHGRVRIAAVVAVDQLRKTQRAGQPGRPAANNGDVRFHLRTVDAFEGFAEN